MESIQKYIDLIINIDYIWIVSNFFLNFSIESFLKWIVIYFIIIWIAIVIWVTKDITNRTNNIFYQIISIFVVVLLTPLWIIIYLLIRPSRTLYEKNYEEWFFEEDDLDEDTELEKLHCFSCNYEIKADYKFCPHCRTKLKNSCILCHKDLELEWDLCPYCWTNQFKKQEIVSTIPLEQLEKDHKETINEIIQSSNNKTEEKPLENI